MIEGSIASRDGRYVLGLRGSVCHTGAMLDEEETEVARREDVLDALGRLARTFRIRVGESLATVEQHNTPAGRSDHAITRRIQGLQHRAPRALGARPGRAAAFQARDRDRPALRHGARLPGPHVRRESASPRSPPPR